MTKFKVVLDTNVYLSAIIFGGNTRHILDLTIKGEIKAYISYSILFEIAEKLEKKFHWDKDQIIVTIKTLAKSATVVNPTIKLDVVRNDRNDNKIIEAAMVSNADYIITGDKHLLKIKKYQEVQIVTPTQFFSIYFKE